ncbi:MAG TPA: DUF2934 domain-containing protein [Beijerinckiaceae bacterium]|jgi:hypothetical protein|nr:DUF2934 domain-containing protein [Beijerinckiaceae bacterium]
MDVAIEDRVRSRAYEIWEAEGRPSDRSLIHWDLAMREIVSLATMPAPKKKAGKASAEAVVASQAKDAKRRRARISALN